MDDAVMGSNTPPPDARPSTTPMTERDARTVLGLLDVRARSIRIVRAADASSPGNGNWSVELEDGSPAILRRYAWIRERADLAYESRVVAHLSERGWTVPVHLTSPIRYAERLWTLQGFVPGEPIRFEVETARNRFERGVLMARLHEDLRDLRDTLGARPAWPRGHDLAGALAQKDWAREVAGLRSVRPDLADRTERAIANVLAGLAKVDFAALPSAIVHGDFAAWNVHCDRAGRAVGVIDFDLTHLDCRVWEFVLARVHRAPELLDGYDSIVGPLGRPLAPEETALIPLLERAFRIDMIAYELLDAPTPDDIDLATVTRQLVRAETGGLPQAYA